MIRRKFILSSLSCAAVPFMNVNAVYGKPAQRFPELKNLETIDRVKLALLTIQRASWEHGVAAQAFLEYGDEEMALMFAKEAILRQNADGQLSVIYHDNGVTDPAASGEAVIFAFRKTGDPKFREGYEKMLDYLLNKAPKTNGILHHVKDKSEVWIDAMYMAPPFLSAAGEYNEAMKQIRGFRQCLWSPEKKLFSHMYNIAENRFIRKDFWGVGNGWAAAALARVIATLPVSLKNEKNELIDLTKQLLEGCIRFIRPDGLFHDVIDNPDTFVETNLSQMLAYTIYRGISDGWLESVWQEKADKMRKAALAKIDEWGFVQGVCGSPYFNAPGTAAEGQAFHILMEAAFLKYKGLSDSSY